jgi:exodeoxyribonuclease VII small subunit
MKRKSSSFEDKIGEFEQIVEKLEDDTLPLDDAIEYFYKGMKLSKEISNRLDELEGKVSILLSENEKLVEKNFEIGE